MWLSYLHGFDTICTVEYAMCAIERHNLHDLRYLKYTIGTIYTIEIHFALVALLKYTICTISTTETHYLHHYTVERRYLHYLHF